MNPHSFRPRSAIEENAAADRPPASVPPPEECRNDFFQPHAMPPPYPEHVRPEVEAPNDRDWGVLVTNVMSRILLMFAFPGAILLIVIIGAIACSGILK
jgi:hypothetical protein